MNKKISKFFIFLYFIFTFIIFISHLLHYICICIWFLYFLFYLLLFNMFVCVCVFMQYIIQLSFVYNICFSIHCNASKSQSTPNSQLKSIISLFFCFLFQRIIGSADNLLSFCFCFCSYFCVALEKWCLVLTLLSILFIHKFLPCHLPRIAVLRANLT